MRSLVSANNYVFVTQTCSALALLDIVQLELKWPSGVNVTLTQLLHHKTNSAITCQNLTNKIKRNNFLWLVTAPPAVKPVEEQLTEMTYNLCILQLCLQVSMTHLTSKTISLMVEWCCWVLPPMVMVQMVTSAPEQCCRRGWSWPVISVSLTPTTPLTLSNILQWSTGDQSHHAWPQRAELSWS